MICVNREVKICCNLNQRKSEDNKKNDLLELIAEKTINLFCYFCKN